MTATLIGYARCSTDKQDLAAQRAMLEELGVAPERIYMDRGLTGTTRARPGLDQALAAVRAGDTLVVPKLDRLARSVPDARQIPAASGGAFRAGGHYADFACFASTCPSKEAVSSIGGICPPNPLTRMPFLPTASSGASWHDFVKAHASRSFRTLFGTCKLYSPRLEHCDCKRRKTSSFRPLSALLTESVAPEL